MDQDDLEDEVLTKTLMAHLEVFSTAFRPIYIWTYRNVPIEIVYALAVVLSLALCFAKRKGLINLEFGNNNSTQEECCEQRLADAAVFAIKGRRATMEDRFAMVQVPIPHLADNPVVRIFAIMDGHGGQVMCTLNKQLMFFFGLSIAMGFFGQMPQNGDGSWIWQVISVLRN